MGGRRWQIAELGQYFFFHSCTVHFGIIKVLLFHQRMHYIFV
jgi:hypothetical protein